MNILALSTAPSLRLLGAGQSKMFDAAPSQHLTKNVWILELITTGQLEISVEDGDWYILNRSRGVLYAPGTNYREKVPEAGQVAHSIHIWFELSSSDINKAWDRFDVPFLLVQDEEVLLLKLAEHILHHLSLSVADNLLANAAFYEVMAHLLRAALQDHMMIVSNEASGSDLISRAHRYMRAELHRSVTLEHIANAVGLSVSGFAHAYKRQTGISPMMALRQMRIEVAKSHLMRDRLSLAQIAQETGFADAFHLSRTFKQTVGVSPRRFRQGLLKTK
jgi:AraC-like DNA-binding protein